MEGDHHPAWAVVVYHQIVDPGDFPVRQHQLLHLPDEFRRRRRAKQGIDGILCGVDPALEDKQRHQNTHPAVNGDAGEMPHQCGEQHGKGGHAVAERVRGSGQQNRGVQPFTDGAVVYRHIQFHADGRRQNPNHQPAEIHQRGVQNLSDGLLGQLHAHQQDQSRHHQP